MKAALSPEEWAETREKWHSGPSRCITSDERCEGGCRIEDADRHGLAALCLYAQPFGFTMADVALLRWEAEGCRQQAMKFVDRPGPEMWSVSAAGLESLADRIKALLPPSV